MMTQRPLVLALPLAALAAAGLAAALAPSAGSSPPAAATSEVVARVGGRAITASELEARTAPELAQLETQRFQVLERALAGLVEERLVEAEAARRGLAPEELFADEVTAKAAPVTEAEVDAFFQANRARIRQPKEEISGQIRDLLQRERLAARQAELLAELRGRHGVEILLVPPRVEIDLAGAPTKGPADAPVTLVEFSDFQCPACQRLNPSLLRLRETYGDELRIAFRHFPLTGIHPEAFQAAEASLCAGEQGKFWPMHDSLFADQGRLQEEDLKARAAALELDADRFARCLEGGEARARVEADVAAGQRLGVHSTPTIFINGRPVLLLSGTPLYDQLAREVDDELGRKTPASAAP